jgi:hypothetical protein
MEKTGQNQIDPMSQYHSRKTAKVVTPTAKRTEWQEQLAFCKWLKMQYQQVRFRSDIQSAGKLSPAMQNIKSIIDPFRGWPDITIYHKRGNYCGLMIELKRENSGLYLKDGSLSNDKHVQEQNEVHEFLRQNGWYVVFAEGMADAKVKFDEYLKII